MGALAAFAGDAQDPVTLVVAVVADVSAESFGDPDPAEDQQGV